MAVAAIQGGDFSKIDSRRNYMTRRLISLKRIFGVLAIGGALLFGVGAASAQTFQRYQRGPVIVYRQNDRNWERERRREWQRRERERRRLMHQRRWRDRWGVWHRY